MRRVTLHRVPRYCWEEEISGSSSVRDEHDPTCYTGIDWFIKTPVLTCFRLLIVWALLKKKTNYYLDGIFLPYACSWSWRPVVAFDPPRVICSYLGWAVRWWWAPLTIPSGDSLSRKEIVSDLCGIERESLRGSEPSQSCHSRVERRDGHDMNRGCWVIETAGSPFCVWGDLTVLPHHVIKASAVQGTFSLSAHPLPSGIQTLTGSDHYQRGTDRSFGFLTWWWQHLVATFQGDTDISSHYHTQIWKIYYKKGTMLSHQGFLSCPCRITLSGSR